jgi:hypothetical protein
LFVAHALCVPCGGSFSRRRESLDAARKVRTPHTNFGWFCFGGTLRLRTLRAAGVLHPAANGSSSTSRAILASVCNSRGIRLSSRRYGTDSKISRRRHATSWHRKALWATEVPNHRNATLRGHEETVEEGPVGKPSSALNIPERGKLVALRRRWCRGILV